MQVQEDAAVGRKERGRGSRPMEDAAVGRKERAKGRKPREDAAVEKKERLRGSKSREEGEGQGEREREGERDGEGEDAVKEGPARTSNELPSRREDKESKGRLDRMEEEEEGEGEGEEGEGEREREGEDVVKEGPARTSDKFSSRREEEGAPELDVGWMI
jgi:hypothetical protein